MSKREENQFQLFHRRSVQPWNPNLCIEVWINSYAVSTDGSMEMSGGIFIFDTSTEFGGLCSCTFGMISFRMEELHLYFHFWELKQKDYGMLRRLLRRNQYKKFPGAPAVDCAGVLAADWIGPTLALWLASNCAVASISRHVDFLFTTRYQFDHFSVDISHIRGFVFDCFSKPSQVTYPPDQSAHPVRK